MNNQHSYSYMGKETSPVIIKDFLINITASIQQVYKYICVKERTLLIEIILLLQKWWTDHRHWSQAQVHDQNCQNSALRYDKLKYGNILFLHLESCWDVKNEFSVSNWAEKWKIQHLSQIDNGKEASIWCRHFKGFIFISDLLIFLGFFWLTLA